MITLGTDNLSGTGKTVTITELRPGTQKEIATFEVETDANMADSVVASFKYNGETSSTFSIYPGIDSFASCDTSVDEVQYITTSTSDTTTAGGDHEVDMYLQFRLRYGSEVTDWINANPDAGVSGYCDSAATAISTQLEAFSVFDTVAVTYTTPNNGDYQECEWQGTAGA